MSTFATVRLRAKVTKGAGSRAVNGARLVPLVRAGARFERGQLLEHPEPVAA
jgi:putative transposase